MPEFCDVSREMIEEIVSLEGLLRRAKANLKNRFDIEVEARFIDHFRETEGRGVIDQVLLTDVRVTSSYVPEKILKPTGESEISQLLDVCFCGHGRGMHEEITGTCNNSDCDCVGFRLAGT